MTDLPGDIAPGDDATDVHPTFGQVELAHKMKSLTLEQTEALRDARTAYMDAAIAEMHAVCNVIDNVVPSRSKLMQDYAQQQAVKAQTLFTEYVQLAHDVLPDNPAVNAMYEQIGDLVDDLNAVPDDQRP